MKNYFKEKMIQTTWKMREISRQLLREEGETNFVAIIVLIVIIIAIAGIFQDSLTAAVEQVFENLMDFIG